MPKITTQKLLLVLLIAVIGATVASMTQAGTFGSSVDRRSAWSASSITCSATLALTPIKSAGISHANQTPMPPYLMQTTRRSSWQHKSRETTLCKITRFLRPQ
jgi:hypothetical protein